MFNSFPVLAFTEGYWALKRGMRMALENKLHAERKKKKVTTKNQVESRSTTVTVDHLRLVSSASKKANSNVINKRVLANHEKGMLNTNNIRFTDHYGNKSQKAPKHKFSDINSNKMRIGDEYITDDESDGVGEPLHSENDLDTPNDQDEMRTILTEVRSEKAGLNLGKDAVSYTHLTLPTTSRV